MKDQTEERKGFGFEPPRRKLKDIDLEARRAWRRHTDLIESMPGGIAALLKAMTPAHADLLNDLYDSRTGTHYDDYGVELSTMRTYVYRANKQLKELQFPLKIVWKRGRIWLDVA